MFEAIASDDIRTVQGIIALKGREALNTPHEKNNQLPLHAAAQHGNVEILELLTQLAKPEEINGADKNKWTPLHFASAEGHLLCLERLLRKKPDVRSTTDEGSTILHYIIRKRPPLEHRGLFTQLLDQLLAAGLDVNCKNKYGETPLHQACARNRVLAVRYLLDHGADMTAVTGKNDTPLHYAAGGHVDCVRLLLSRGATPNAPKGTRGTPRDIAVKVGGELLKLMDNPPVRDVKQEEKDDAEESRRSKIILELQSTERSYVQNLSLMVELYMNPLLERQLITADDSKAIFANAQELLASNSALLKAIESRLGEWEQGQIVGDLFADVQKYLSVYPTFVINYDSALIKLKKLRKKSSKLVAFLEEQKNRPESRKLDLDSLLIMPVQRVPRYVLLLKDLLKNTEDSHRDWAHLQRAVERLQEVAEDINEKKRDAENLNQMLKVAAHLPKDAQPALLRKNRVFVKECKAAQIARETGGTNTSARLFLFNDLLLFCRKRAGQPALFRLEHLQVRENENPLALTLALKPGSSPSDVAEFAAPPAPSSGSSSPQVATATSTVSGNPLAMFASLFAPTDLPLRITFPTAEERAAWMTDVATAMDSLLTPHIVCKSIERLGKAPQPRAGAVSWVDDNSSKLYVYGGSDAGVVLGDISVLDVKTNQWSPEPYTPEVPPRAYHAVAQLTDGAALFFGGQDKAGAPLSDMYRYEKKRMRKLEPTGEQPSARFGHAMVFDVATNSVLCFGGATGPAEGNALNDLYTYDILRNTWSARSAKGDPPAPRLDACAAVLKSSLVVYGGWVPAAGGGPQKYLPSNEIFVLDFLSNTWTQQRASNPSAAPAKLFGPAFVLSGEEEIVVLGDDERGNRLLYRLSSKQSEWYWERNLINGPAPAAKSWAFAVALTQTGISRALHLFGGFNGKIFTGDIYRVSLARVDTLQQVRTGEVVQSAISKSGSSITDVSASHSRHRPTNSVDVVSVTTSSTSVSSASETVTDAPAGPLLKKEPTRIGPPSPQKTVPREGTASPLILSGPTLTVSSGTVAAISPKASTSPVHSSSAVPPASSSPTIPHTTSFTSTAPGFISSLSVVAPNASHISPPSRNLSYPFDEPESPLAPAASLLPDGKLTAATLSRILERASDPSVDPVEPEFVEDLVLTHHMVTKPADLLEYFLMRFNGPPADTPADDPRAVRYRDLRKTLQPRVAQILKRWIARSPHDWTPAPGSLSYSLLERLEKFHASEIASAEASTKALISDCIALARQQQADSQVHRSGSGKISPAPNAGSASDARFARGDVDEWAKQITLIESSLYKAASAADLCAPFNPQSTHVLAILGFSKKLYFWILNEILSGDTKEARGAAIDRSIRLAVRFRLINNWSSLVVMVHALCAPALVRLRESWRCVPNKQIEALEELAALVRPAGGFRTLADLVEGSPMPCVPPLIVYLIDAALLHGKKTIVTPKADPAKPNATSVALVNWEKMRLLARRISQFMRAQPGSYNFDPNRSLQEALLAAVTPHYEELKRIALEKNEPPSADELVVPKRFSLLVQHGLIAHQLLYELPIEPPYLGERDWRVIYAGARARVRVCAANDVILQDGALSNCLYRIRSGTVRVDETLYDRRRPLILSAGQVFGEHSLLDSPLKPRLSATAYGACEVYVMELRPLAELLRLKPRLGLRVFRAVAASLSLRLKNLPLEPPGGASGTPAAAAKAADLLEPSTDLLTRGDLSSFLELRDALGMAPDDVMLKTSPCSLKGTLKDDNGVLHVTAKSVVFHGKGLGLSKKETVPLIPGSTSVEAVSAAKEKDKDSPQLLISSGKRKYQFRFLPGDIASYESVLAMANLMLHDQPSVPGHPFGSVALREEEWTELTRGARKVKLARSEVVIKEGEPCTLYKILKGKCRIDKRAPEGHYVVQGFLNEGQVFGEMALFGQPAPVTVTADPDESTTVLELDLLYVLAVLAKPGAPSSSARPLATGLFNSVALSLWTTLAALQSAPVPKALPDGHLDRVSEGKSRHHRKSNAGPVKRESIDIGPASSGYGTINRLLDDDKSKSSKQRKPLEGEFRELAPAKTASRDISKSPRAEAKH